ncbi:hypothetical protein ACIRL2_45915 [Embleya sp. NPDC127516]|uniref:hypothetical protein n=1 Tax=Embleya sp. NPDC127516 TaxID=3363990 RepID=UPI00382A1D2C
MTRTRARTHASRRTNTHDSTTGCTQHYRGRRTCRHCRAAHTTPPAARAGDGRFGLAPPLVRTLRSVLTEHTTPDGDHLVWHRPGAVPPPHVSWQGRRLTILTVSWLVHRRRPPRGLLRRACRRPDCVAPAHITDRHDRNVQDAVLGLPIRDLDPDSVMPNTRLPHRWTP